MIFFHRFGNDHWNRITMMMIRKEKKNLTLFYFFSVEISINDMKIKKNSHWNSKAHKKSEKRKKIKRIIFSSIVSLLLHPRIFIFFLLLLFFIIISLLIIKERNAKYFYDLWHYWERESGIGKKNQKK